MNKQKIFNKTLLVGSCIVTVFIIAKLLGVLQYALLPTGGNEPTIKRGGWVFLSNILPYDQYKMIAYEQKNPDYESGTYVQRLVGLQGDKIEIKNGLLYVNGKSVDDRFVLKRAYKIDRAFANELIAKGAPEEDFQATEKDYYLTYLTEKISIQIIFLNVISFLPQIL